MMYIQLRVYTWSNSIKPGVNTRGPRIQVDIEPVDINLSRVLVLDSFKMYRI